MYVLNATPVKNPIVHVMRKSAQRGIFMFGVRSVNPKAQTHTIEKMTKARSVDFTTIIGHLLC